ncbi:MAG: hypothetical protein LQ338_008312, partial [Usnochroma carphineum]
HVDIQSELDNLHLDFLDNVYHRCDFMQRRMSSKDYLHAYPAPSSTAYHAIAVAQSISHPSSANFYFKNLP